MPAAIRFAARTSRIRLGTDVVVLPFHHPLRLAEETATLDILSRGRLVVGLGRGNRPQEFLGHGAPGRGGLRAHETASIGLMPRKLRASVVLIGGRWEMRASPAARANTSPWPRCRCRARYTQAL